MNSCYLDNAATTQAHPKAVARMMESFKQDYYNPSAMYKPGMASEKIVTHAKQTIADAIHANADEIIFTSGGSEGDNLIIRGVVDNNRPAVLKNARIITTAIEHPAVMEVFKMYEQQGIDVVYLPVNNEGFVDLDALEAAVNDNTLIVSVMGVNNELGTIQPLEKIGAIIKKKNPDTFFHSDFVQGFMKTPVNVEKAQLDGLTLCAHKINGPKGVGAVYLRHGKRIKPLILGGGQEGGLRSGTENVQGIVGFETAVEVWQDPDVHKRIHDYCDYVITTLTENLDDVVIMGPKGFDGRSPAVLSAAIGGVRGEVLLHAVEARGVYISTGSACSTHKKDKHFVQRAIGLDREHAEGTIRISFSALTTWDEVKNGTAIIVEEAQKLQRFLKLKKH